MEKPRNNPALEVELKRANEMVRNEPKNPVVMAARDYVKTMPMDDDTRATIGLAPGEPLTKKSVDLLATFHLAGQLDKARRQGASGLKR